ncbi:TPM domain-containing protein [Paenimyroides tangerinum]|uniref:TPM domain-containing protein n=1 Tax=Paenimyroides tangerinum TaxID=2488728 RepID=A0A3P3WEM7_9FLAO|nr:TPM domain-containing protein [Paenimyroides tangerinum]RRJ93114.1 TPM domain-containing protein [Paenimyroides tangerinum]
MSITEDFISKHEEQAIIDAINTAESKTSGEIRVHIEEHSDLEVLDRTREVFVLLEMHKTNARNGVLFYIGVRDKSFAIFGDNGINNVVPDDFWSCTKDVVIDHFKQQKFKEGLVAGILRAGEQLQKFFPIQEDDTNELSNEISRG